MAFPKPNAYEIIYYQGRLGIIYDRVPGESLLSWIMRTGDMQGCAVHMARLHRAILQNQICDVPDYKESLGSDIANATSISPFERRRALGMLDSLPRGNTLCHGDFHPGNIFISGEKTMVIDFMNVCHGYFLYDVARTVFLVEHAPVPANVEAGNPILQSRKALADLYLQEMNVARGMVRDYLSVIALARMGECSDE